MTTYSAAVCCAVLITLFLRGERASESEELRPLEPAPFEIVGGVGGRMLDLPRDTRLPAWMFQSQQVQMPRVEGLTLRDAQRALRAQGLLIRPWFRAGAYHVPNWAIVKQDIPAGTLLPSGTPVDVQVSLPAGPQSQYVGAPLVRGLALGDAMRISQALGLGVEVRGVGGEDPNALVLTQEPPAEVVMARGKAAMRLTVLPSDQLLPLAGVELPRATRPEPPPSFTGRTVVVPPPGTPSAIVVPPPAPRVIVRERRRDDGGAGAFIGGFVTGLVFGALADDDDRRYHRHRRSHHVRHRSRPNRGVGRRR